MAYIGGRQPAVVGWTMIVAFGLAWTANRARADRIVLRGGGQIKGKLTPDPTRPDRVTLLTERGKTPLSFQKAQIVRVDPEPGPLDDYLTRRDAAAPTAEAQYELGAWCEQHRLPDLALVHYETAVGYDKSFAPAHRKLGHSLYRDQWLTADERREAQGLVRYKGKWITAEDKEQHAKNTAAADEHATWVKKIKLLREAIAYGTEARRQEAESQLMETRDPGAVVPLVRVLGDDVVRIRILLSHALGAVPGPEATAALVARLLDEGDAEVRQATMDELLRRRESEVSRVLIRGLRSNAPEVVNRAAWALGNLHALTAVPNLVGALVTVRHEVVIAPEGGGGGMGVSAPFGSVPPAPSAGGVPIAYNGSSVGYLTGVSVGPGSVAYGVAAVPAYPLPGTPALPTAPGFGPSPANVGIPAGGGVSGTRGPAPRMVTYSFRNTEVLSALVKLTGQDFGWDVVAWKNWLRTSFDSEPAPARRVPQP